MANFADPSNTWSEVDKSGYIAKEGHGAAKPAFRKRKNTTLGSKSKRLRIDNEMIELKLTWEQAQGLLRPPPNHVPSVVVIEGFEFEEYEVLDSNIFKLKKKSNRNLYFYGSCSSNLLLS